MNRKMCLLCTLMCAVLLSGSASAANIWLSMNLDFNDPTDFDSGGDWKVVAKADEFGIAGIVIMLEDPTLNFDPSTGFLTPDGFEVEETAVFPDVDNNLTRLEIVQGDDLQDPTIDVGVIGGSFPSTYVDHPLITIFGSNDDLGSFTGGVELAQGTFDPGDIPTWFDDGNDKSSGNVFLSATPTIGSAAEVFTTVRYVAIPEPTTCLLWGLGTVALIGIRPRSRTRTA